MAKNVKKVEKLLISYLKNKNIDNDKLNFAFDLIKDVAFMTVKSEELRNKIEQNGIIEKYQNGANQFGVKKSASFEAYILMTKQKSALIKQLTDLLPEGEIGNNTDKDDFDDFLNKRENK